MISTQSINVETHGEGHTIDITPHIKATLSRTGAAEGLATVFISGSTAAVTAVEYEPGLMADLQALFQRLAPRELSYRHDRRWGDGNGHAHVRASLLGSSLIDPFLPGRTAPGGLAAGGAGGLRCLAPTLPDGHPGPERVALPWAR